MRFPLAFLVFLSCCAAAPPTREGNFFRFPLSDGSGELEWITPSSFRLARRWGGPLPRTRAIRAETIAVTMTGRAPLVEIKSKYLTIEVDAEQFSMKVSSNEGKLLVAGGPDRKGEVAHRIAPEERIYGLGYRSGENFDARGARLSTPGPFLTSSVGYGLHLRGPASYAVDVASTKSDELRISQAGSDRIEYFLYYGPSPKDIVEEHSHVVGFISWKPADLELIAGSRIPKDGSALPKAGVCESIRALAHSSLSGMILPALDLAAFRGQPGVDYRRASALGLVTPLLYDSEASSNSSTVAGLRSRLVPYLTTYFQEAQDRGYPLIRSIPFEYPADSDGAVTADQFLLGDELLVAPVCGASTRRSVYLPKGIWTDLRTNAVHPGRQRIEVGAEGDFPPILVRNGSIIPMQMERARSMELHYFPSLGAEFFLWEPDVEENTQFHASPAADYWRLEIESKRTRVYEWILHHKPAPKSVAEGEMPYQPVDQRARLKPGAWWHDTAATNLHIMVDGAAGQDRIINLSF